MHSGDSVSTLPETYRPTLCKPKYRPDRGHEDIDKHSRTAGSWFYVVISGQRRGDIFTSWDSLHNATRNEPEARYLYAATWLNLMRQWDLECTEFHNHEAPPGVSIAEPHLAQEVPTDTGTPSQKTACWSHKRWALLADLAKLNQEHSMADAEHPAALSHSAVVEGHAENEHHMRRVALLERLAKAEAHLEHAIAHQAFDAPPPPLPAGPTPAPLISAALGVSPEWSWRSSASFFTSYDTASAFFNDTTAPRQCKHRQAFKPAPLLVDNAGANLEDMRIVVISEDKSDADGPEDSESDTDAEGAHPAAQSHASRKDTPPPWEDVVDAGSNAPSLSDDVAGSRTQATGTMVVYGVSGHNRIFHSRTRALAAFQKSPRAELLFTRDEKETPRSTPSSLSTPGDAQGGEHADPQISKDTQCILDPTGNSLQPATPPQKAPKRSRDDTRREIPHGERASPANRYAARLNPLSLVAYNYEAEEDESPPIRLRVEPPCLRTEPIRHCTSLPPSPSVTATPGPDEPMDDVVLDAPFQAPTREAFLAAAPTCKDQNPHHPSPAHDPLDPQAIEHYASVQSVDPSWTVPVMPDHVVLDNMSDDIVAAVAAAPDTFLAVTVFCYGETLAAQHKNIHTDVLGPMEEVGGKGKITLIRPTVKVAARTLHRGITGNKPNKFLPPIALVARCKDVGARTKLIAQGTCAATRLTAFHVTPFAADCLSWAIGFFKTDIVDPAVITERRLCFAAYEGIRREHFSRDQRLHDFASTFEGRFLAHAENPVYVLFAKPCTRNAKLWDEIRAAMRTTHTDDLETFIPHANAATGHNLCADCKLDCHPKYNCTFTVRDKSWWGPLDLASAIRDLKGIPADEDDEDEGFRRGSPRGRSSRASTSRPRGRQ
ncbi:hypothetical protein B0H17DRAFT_1195427 [Mycena rosella]|uniref:Uncharacterized protein n=1 Tax=Mycena rosella TaxID=1033263 RepID=A0AAD7DYV8_MYCRO|nr:hypothetical protein B0H17DRAFT_1195427 [Mycena rosella]